MAPFEEVKDDSDKPDVPRLPNIGELVEFIVSGIVITAIASGIAGLCWNHIAPRYLEFLPAKWQSVGWLDVFCVYFIIRSTMMAVFGLGRGVDGQQ